MASDELEGYPLTVNLDTHYYFNSKAALCTSGLPSPKSTLLELSDFSTNPEYCCDICRYSPINLSISPECKDARGQWLRNQIARILTQVSAQELPFVLKTQQTSSGGGTFLVASVEDLPGLKSTLSTQILPKLLSQVNVFNAHLKPATLIISGMIRNPIAKWSVTFFVTRAGECIFRAATEQVVDSANARIGSMISYTAQDSLKQKFTPILREIGAWLHRYDYYGPCGADILETAPTDNDGDGSRTLNIVDLNIPTSGFLVLGLMRGQFSHRRGLNAASSFPVDVKMSRENFIRKFGSQFRAGNLVIGTWYEDGDSKINHGTVFIGARDKKALEKDVATVKELASEIHS